MDGGHPRSSAALDPRRSRQSRQHAHYSLHSFLLALPCLALPRGMCTSSQQNQTSAHMPYSPYCGIPNLQIPCRSSCISIIGHASAEKPHPEHSQNPLTAQRLQAFRRSLEFLGLQLLYPPSRTDSRGSENRSAVKFCKQTARTVILCKEYEYDGTLRIQYYDSPFLLLGGPSRIVCYSPFPWRCAFFRDLTAGLRYYISTKSPRAIQDWAYFLP
jgi:hypothetical protein